MKLKMIGEAVDLFTLHNGNETLANDEPTNMQILAANPNEWILLLNCEDLGKAKSLRTGKDSKLFQI